MRLRAAVRCGVMCRGRAGNERGGKKYVDVFFFQAEDGIRDGTVTVVQTCALPISGDRINGLAEMRRGWTLLHENDCYLCEPFWGMQVAVANAEVGQVVTALDILKELIRSEERRVRKECRSRWRSYH